MTLLGIVVGTITLTVARALYYYWNGIETEMPMGIAVGLSPILAMMIALVAYGTEFVFALLNYRVTNRRNLFLLGLSYSTPLAILIHWSFVPLAVAINPITVHVYCKIRQRSQPA